MFVTFAIILVMFDEPCTTITLEDKI